MIMKMTKTWVGSRDTVLLLQQRRLEWRSKSKSYLLALLKLLLTLLSSPEKFFTEHTLTSTEARKWLSSHLSAAESVVNGKPGPRPHIWLLTGLVLMQHATWTRLSSKDRRFVAGERAPFIPAGVSAIRRSSVSDDVKPTFGYRANEEDKHIPGGHIIHETGKYPGTRGWAAQWLRVDSQVMTAKKGEAVASNQITLKRAPQIAVVKLREDVYPENDEEEDEEDNLGEFDDEYWDTFLDEADD